MTSSNLSTPSPADVTRSRRKRTTPSHVHTECMDQLPWTGRLTRRRRVIQTLTMLRCCSAGSMMPSCVLNVTPVAPVARSSLHQQARQLPLQRALTSRCWCLHASACGQQQGVPWASLTILTLCCRPTVRCAVKGKGGGKKKGKVASSPGAALPPCAVAPSAHRITPFTSGCC